MLIRFVVSNFLSFRDATEFNLLPGTTEKHREHLLKGHPIELLPLGIILGANAAGKTNLLRAMQCARALIVEGTRDKTESFELSSFKLDPESKHKPTSFEFEYIIDGRAYAFGLVLRDREVIEEWLYEIDGKDENPLFERTGKQFTFGKRFTASDLAFLQNESRGTRINQPFLTECARRDVPFFEEAYLWFRDKLAFVFPHSPLVGMGPRLANNDDYKSIAQSALSIADFGIDSIDLRPLKLPEEVMRDVSRRLHHTRAKSIILNDPEGKRINVYKDENGSLHASHLVAIHRGIPFDLNEESEGTQRLINLIPRILAALEHDAVLIVDELEASLHANLCQTVLSLFLRAVSQGNAGQLIFSTHNTNLLDLAIIREDEVWLTEKRQDGSTDLYPLSDFKEFPKNIQRGYVMGRFGAIPRINPNAQLNHEEDDGQN